MAEIRKIKGAAYWASYIINGDASGLEAAEQELCDAWLARELDDCEDIVDCGEAFFSWHYGLHTGADCAGGDLLEYTVIRVDTGEDLEELRTAETKAANRIADRVDGYDRDDLGESPDY